MFSKVTTWLGGQQRAVDTSAEELALCRRIAAGETQLFARVVERYSGLVASVIAAQGVVPADIDDIAQLAFVNAYKGLAGFRGEAKLSSWLYRIALNAARQHLKRRSMRPALSSVEEAMESGQQPVDQRRAESTSWTHNRVLAAALRQLPEVPRTALCLFYFEELSYEEIAATLRLNLNTVRTHIRRGKLRLAELLDADALGELL